MEPLRGFILNTLFFGRGKDMIHHSMRALALVLSVLLTIGCVPFDASAEEFALPASDLSNLAYILNNESDTDLRVVYLGGSVTAGAGATKANEGSWRALVGKWFTETVGEDSAYGKTSPTLTRESVRRAAFSALTVFIGTVIATKALPTYSSSSIRSTTVTTP